MQESHARKHETHFARRQRKRMCFGKRRYRDKRAALASLHGFQNYSAREAVPRRSYYCANCRGYHLTKNDRMLGGGE